jgi:glycosyltransferase involved in cell wall biosynthesis
MPKYTILMPARNAESTIKSAVTSALHAFPHDAHVAVWDDASNDATSEVLQGINSPRVSVITSPQSVGSGIARQRLLETTDSEFVAVQDADDISLPWRQKLQSTHLASADFSFTTTQRFSAIGRIHKPALPFNYSPHDVPIALIFHNPLAHSTMIARRAALDDIGGYGNSRVAQDYEMLLRAAAAGKKIKRAGVVSVLYRVSMTQISAQEDYGDRIISNKTISQSYYRNLSAVANTPLSSAHKNAGSFENTPTISLDEVKPLVHRMSPHLRHYYYHLCDHKRLGHLAAHILI